MLKQTIKANMRDSDFKDLNHTWLLAAKTFDKVVLRFNVLTKPWTIETLLLSVVIALLLLGGCSSVPVQASSSSTLNTVPDTGASDSIQMRLQKQYLAWKGVPYREGGSNKRGVDCSGFVHITFKKALGLNVPRTTRQLMKIGKLIPRQQLSVGDLVFFKTGYSKHHVGIYIGKNQFIHASTSKGVIKSNLKSTYWRKHYWKSSRILNL